MKNKVVSRLITLILALAMVVTNLPMTAFATEIEEPQSETTVEEQITTFSTKESTLAPGITESINSGYAADGKLINYYVAVADISREDVGIHTTYKDAQCTTTGMAKMTDQVVSMEKLHSNPDDEANYIPYYAIVAGVNGDGYNTGSGKPSGAHVMNGVSGFGIKKAENSSWFAIFEDGTALCGANNTDWDEAVAAHGPAQEAIGGFQLVRKNGKDVPYKDSDYLNDGRYPRSFVGVTADNKVVFMEADGNGSGGSAGTNWKESVEIMDEAGCTYILCLDGGGSATYVSRPVGSNKVKVTSKPSDGSERAVSNGIVMYTTTPPSDTFEKAEISAENYYVTPGAEVKVSAVGISPAGTAADIPENAVWKVTNGTIENGVFISDGTIGEAKITLTVDDTVVGNTTINVVLPDKIEFSREMITVPYGATVELDVLAKYGLNTVVLKEGDITFTVSDEKTGTISGNKFTAGETGEGTTITVSVNGTSNVTDTLEVKFGKGSEKLFDFEEGNIGANLKNWRVSHHGGYAVSDLSIVTKETGMVRSGDQALAFHYPMDEALHGTEFWSGNSLVWTGNPVEIKNASSIGFWVYVPEDATQFSIYMSASVHDEAGNFAGKSGSSMEIYNEDYINNREHSGWMYFEMPVKAKSVYIEDNADKIGQYFNGSQFKLKANCFIEFYAVNIDAWKNEETNFAGDFTFYIDDVTINYSNAVEDREKPIFSGMTYAVDGMSDAATLNGQTVTEKVVDLAALVTEDTTNKDNASGLDASTAVAYIDGTKVECKYTDGKITVSDANLTDGVHTIRMGISDKSGNYSETKKQITVKSGDNDASVRVCPQDSTLNYILNDAVYWINVEADDIEKVKSVEAKLDLDSMNNWELDHMEVLHGFDCEYSYATAAEKAENILTIKFTRNDNYLSKTGTAVLASIPIRVWEYVCSDDHIHGNAVEAWKCNYVCAPALSIDVDTEMGVVTYLDDTSHSFSSADIHTSSVSYTYGLKVRDSDKEFYNSHSYHLHNEVAIEDKEATCTTDGYTGRTVCKGEDGTRKLSCSTAEHKHTLEANCYQLTCKETATDHKHTTDKCYKVICKKTVHTHTNSSGACYYTHKSCNSIVDWGTTIPATGHKFEITDNVLKCKCGQTYTGVWTDGKEYNDGISYADGWVGDSYYKDGAKLKGVQLVDGYYYDFGENGVCEGKAKFTGLFYDETVSAYRYSKLGELLSGWVKIEEDWHYFLYTDKCAAVGTHIIGNSKVNYQFDETGKTEGAWKITNEGIRFWYGPEYYKARNHFQCMFVEIDGKTYNFDINGYMTTGIHALYDDWASMTRGEMKVWEFDENGVLIGQITDKGVINNKRDGLYLIEEDGFVHGGSDSGRLASYNKGIYFVLWSGKLLTNASRWVGASQANGLLKPDTYYFGKDGKLYTGVAEGPDDLLYYYKDGKICSDTYNSELIAIDDDIYLVKWSGKVAMNEERYISSSKANDLLESGVYIFGKDGKLLTGIEKGTDGDLYYYESGKLCKGIYNSELVEINNSIYLVKWSGRVAANETRVITKSNSNGLLIPGSYYFGEDGKLFTFTGITKNPEGDLCYYIDGKLCSEKYNSELVEINNSIYLVKWSGKVAANEQRYISDSKTNKLLEAGTYLFGEDGKIFSGIKVEEDGNLCYYNAGKLITGVYNSELVEINGAIYLVKWSGKVAVNEQRFISKSKTNGLVEPGTYTFDSNGRLLNK